MALRRSWTLVSLGMATLGVGCGIIAGVDRRLIPTDEPTGGAGGGECSLPRDCPSPNEVCTVSTCVEGFCGTALAQAGTSCIDGECNATGQCVSMECANGLQDGAETDVDCGGGACPGCEAGQSCLTREDCATRLCEGAGGGDAGTCATCATDDDCFLTDYCSDGGSCTVKVMVGLACTRGGECRSDFCVDGFCCENACDGTCATCAEPGREGNCRPYGPGTDPELECGADTCGGTTACRCDNGQQDGMETGVDCGPAECRACDGATCNDPAECAGPYCVNNQCVSEICGDGNVDGAETCDDGNTVSYDGCASTCSLPTTHPLITEMKLGLGAFVEIYNPTANAILLQDAYLADHASYFQITAGGTPPSTTDFTLRFPTGATLAPGAFAVVALSSAGSFNGVHGQNPDFDLDPADLGAPAMVGTFTNGSAALEPDGQPLMLFTWNGFSTLVTDLDYLIVGDATAGVDKTGVSINGGTYGADTALASQSSAPALGAQGGLTRCDTAEVTETKMMGNGSGNHDETSEDFAAAFVATATPTPGAPPASGACP